MKKITFLLALGIFFDLTDGINRRTLTAAQNGVPVDFSTRCELTVFSGSSSGSVSRRETWNGDVAFLRGEEELVLVGLHPERGNLAIRNDVFDRGDAEWGYQWVDVEYPESDREGKREYQFEFTENSLIITVNWQELIEIRYEELSSTPSEVWNIDNIKFKVDETVSASYRFFCILESELGPAIEDTQISYDPKCDLTVVSGGSGTYGNEVWNGDVAFLRDGEEVLLVGLHPERGNLAIRNDLFDRGDAAWGYQWVDVEYPGTDVHGKREYQFRFTGTSLIITSDAQTLISIPYGELTISGSIIDEISAIQFELSGQQSRPISTDFKLENCRI